MEVHDYSAALDQNNELEASSMSARTAIDSLLSSERVLDQLRLVLLTQYLKSPESFSANLGDLLSEYSTEQQIDPLEQSGSYLPVDLLEIEISNVVRDNFSTECLVDDAKPNFKSTHSKTAGNRLNTTSAFFNKEGRLYTKTDSQLSESVIKRQPTKKKFKKRSQTVSSRLLQDTISSKLGKSSKYVKI